MVLYAIVFIILSLLVFILICFAFAPKNTEESAKENKQEFTEENIKIQTSGITEDIMFCSNCKKEIDDNVTVCNHCGSPNNTVADKWLFTLLFFIFLGGFGAHRFYNGLKLTGTIIALLALPVWFEFSKKIYGIPDIILFTWLSLDLIAIIIAGFKTADKTRIVWPENIIFNLIKKYCTKENIKKYATKENILNYFFLIVAGFVFAFFLLYAFGINYHDTIYWDWDIFKKCLWPCFALVFLHYVSKIAKSFHEIANKNKNK